MALPSLRLHYEPNLHRALFQDAGDLSVSHLNPELLASFIADPVGSTVSLRDLYRRRSRGEANEELQSHIRVLLHLLKFRLDNVPFEEDCARVLRVIEDYQVFPLLTEVLLNDDFFREDVDFVVHILEVVYRALSLGHHLDAPLNGHCMVLSSVFCESVLRGHSWFKDGLHVASGTSRYDASVLIHRALIPNILLLLSEELFSETQGLRQACLLGWITNPVLDDPKYNTPILSIAMLQHVLAGVDVYPSQVEQQEAFCASISQYIIPTFGGDLYLRQVAKMLRNEAILQDDILELMLPVTSLSIISHPMLLTNSTLSDVLIAMLDIYGQQAIKSVYHRERRVVFEFLDICTRLMPHAQNSASARSSITTITRDGRLFDVLSRALCIFVTDPLLMDGAAHGSKGYRQSSRRLVCHERASDTSQMSAKST
ncbi:unnamed protein product [Peniophora sp. CBMAI 1063]|nr:unnamed protein product [Peniophora sp. CBMAI 1063]